MSEPQVYHNALPLPGALHEYRLEQVLGTGGFGITYLARDTHLDKQVAIKEYLPSSLAVRAADGTVRPLATHSEPDYRWGLERFLQEARTLAKFSHPGIVRVLRYFEAHGTAYMVMDYERGESLKSRLGRSPPLPEAAFGHLLAPLLDGLSAVHAAGFLHRDIKPDNIIVRADGSPVLIDFGAARNAIGGATRALTAILTPGYAPLEQYAGEGRQGPWTDLYALGGVLYRGVTGDNPPDAVTRIHNDVVGAGLDKAATRFSQGFLQAIRWALALEEKNRPQSVAQWRGALDAARAAQATAPTAPTARPAQAAAPTVRLPQTAAPVPAEEKPPKRRRWVLYSVLGVLILAAAAIFLGKLAPRQQSAPPEKLERMQRSAEAEFRSADANGDGFLSLDEVRGRFPFLAREFARADTNGDGRISPREFLEFRRAQFERRK
jgi:serine/threonine protein kinase